MCFVSYVPLAGGFLLGSNRDEYLQRVPASEPDVSATRFGCLLSPRDGKAGGTWIAVRDDGYAAVLLNGGREPHIYSPPYSRSRGTIIPEIMQAARPDIAMQHVDLKGVEPFTLVVANGAHLVEMVWNGNVRSVEAADTLKPFCRSSATLYDTEQQGKRAAWFMEQWEAGTFASAGELAKWHSKGGFGPATYDIRMQRTGGLLTVSTTVVEVIQGKAIMKYIDHLGQPDHGHEDDALLTSKYFSLT
ncbi:MAG TPA: NRDE family protein [Phnomibacter sp.]|nr:NRDE family protein [Phnomibacter sp.]